MLRRPAARSSSIARAASSSSSSLAASSTRRHLSSSPNLLLRHHVKPHTSIFPKSERKDPLTVRQLEDISITEQLTAAAGTTVKERIGKGIAAQTTYFEREAMRLDRDVATQTILEGLPPLTEADIDDFYINLMASGNELSNLTTLPSPNRTAALREAENERILQHESKEAEAQRIAVEKNIKVIKENVETRQQMLLAAHSLQQPAASWTRQLKAPGEIRPEYETIGVPSTQEESKGEHRLEINEAGEAVAEQWRVLPPSSSSPLEDDSSPKWATRSEQETPNNYPGKQKADLSTRNLPRRQSFEERYPHASRLSFPPPELNTALAITNEESSAASESFPSFTPTSSPPVKGPTPFASRRNLSPPSLSTPQQFVAPPSRLSSSNIIATPPGLITSVASSSSQPSPVAVSPSSSSLITFDLPSHLLPSSVTCVPQPSPLLLSLEQSILTAERVRDASAPSSSSYLTLPPLDPKFHPTSPIQPSDSFKKSNVDARRKMTAFQIQPAATPSVSPSDVQYPRPLPSDVKWKMQGEGLVVPPVVVPLGIMTRGEWQAVVYDTLAEPDRLEAERSRDRAKYATKREKKEMAKQALREERRKKNGWLKRRDKSAQAKALQRAGYALLAAKILELMVRAGDRPPLVWFLDILKVLSDSGDVNGVQLVITQSEIAGYKANYETYSHLVLAHLGNNDLHGAVACLHNLESRSLYPNETTYRTLIQPLVTSEIDAHRATGWDLFAHMRLVAHPIPSKTTYDMIIDACANHIMPEPERALDLWTEMTIDNKIPPDVHSFNAIIRAVGSVKTFYLESFRLMRQMLDFYHTSTPDSAQRAMYTPNRATFESLLVGATKNGDIARTRWILTEMIRFSNHSGMRENGSDISPTAETMTWIFQAYANSKPAIKKDDLKWVERKRAKELLRVEGQSEAVAKAAEEGESSVTVEGAVREEFIDLGEMVGEEDGEQWLKEEGDWTEIDSATLQRSLDGIREPESAEDGEEMAAWTSSKADDTPSTSSSSLRQSQSASSPTASSSTETTIPGPEPTPTRGGNVQTSPVPQSSSEILQEARRLLSHARDDAAIFISDPTQRTPAGNLPSLRHVIINTKLVNAFLQVQYRHSDIRESLKAFDATHAEFEVRRDARTYQEVLKMLRYEVNSDQRDEAAEETFRVFQEWETYEKEGNVYLVEVEERSGKDVAWLHRRRMGLEPRIIETIWVTSISTMALAGQLSIALSMLKRFEELYPPQLILQAILPPLPSKALIRMVPRSAHRPDPLPPHILFKDVADLHAAFVKLQQENPIAYIRKVTVAYAAAIHQHRQQKLSDSKTPEGRARARERVFDENLTRVAREEYERKHRKTDDADLKARAGFRSLSNMAEATYGRKPKDLEAGSVEAKIFRVWGKEALDRYLRAKRQF